MKKLYKVGIYCRLSVDDASNSAKAKNYTLLFSSFAGSSSGSFNTPDCAALFDTLSVLASTADRSASGDCMEQAVSKNAIAASK